MIKVLILKLAFQIWVTSVHFVWKILNMKGHSSSSISRVSMKKPLFNIFSTYLPIAFLGNVRLTQPTTTNTSLTKHTLKWVLFFCSYNTYIVPFYIATILVCAFVHNHWNCYWNTYIQLILDHIFYMLKLNSIVGLVELTQGLSFNENCNKNNGFVIYTF